MLTRIAIVSLPGAELDQIRTVVRNPVKFTVREFLSMESCVHELITFPMEILLMRLPVFTENHIPMAQKARRRFHEAAVIVLAKEIQPSARLNAITIDRLKLLQEPTEVSDLASVIAKFRKGDPAIHRLHPRVRRRDLVQIVDSRGQAHRASFIDFAQMGARLAISNMSSVILKARDSVEISYGSSSELGKQNRIAAKVVWASGGLASGSSHTAGVRFIASY